MKGIKIEVIGNIARVVERPSRITSGTVGLPVEFIFDSPWEGLNKTAVFQAGNVQKYMVVVDGVTAVPIEVLAEPNVRLNIGVYGEKEDGSVALPTIWVNLGKIHVGAVPEGSVGTDIGIAKKYQDVAILAAENADASANKAESEAGVAETNAKRAETAASQAEASAAAADAGRFNANGYANKAKEAAANAQDSATTAQYAAESAVETSALVEGMLATTIKSTPMDLGENEKEQARDNIGVRDNSTHACTGQELLELAMSSSLIVGDLYIVTESHPTEGHIVKGSIWEAIEKFIFSFKGNLVNSAPATVQKGANELVDKALSHEDTNLFRFLVFADAHHKTPETGGYLCEEIMAGTKELGQAVSEVLNTIGVDLVANLGDTTWGSSGNDSATCLGEAKGFNRLVCDKIRGQAQLWTEGNHETEFLTASQIHALIYSHNKGIVQDADHWIEGYGYMDFEKQKVRVICLNTNQGTTINVSGMSDKQVKWLAEVALNMEGKTDWNVITMGHHPLSYNTVSLMKYAVETVEAFINGDNFSYKTNDGTTLAIDYSGKNCQYVGHFHGHAHAFSVVRMQKYVSSGVYEEIDAWEICIPNACYTRNNQYLGNTDNPYVARYSTEETYDKTDEDGNRTSFNLVTVCLNDKTIYADNYGAGIDREVDYHFDTPRYTNLLDEAGYVTDTYLSSGVAKTKSGVECTGYMPLDGSGEYAIYLSGIAATLSDNNFRIAFYRGEDESTIVMQLHNTQIETNSHAPVPYETDENGNIVKLDCTAFLTTYLASISGAAPSYFRLCSDNIDENSIITINEKIA